MRHFLADFSQKRYFNFLIRSRLKQLAKTLSAAKALRSNVSRSLVYVVPRFYMIESADRSDSRLGVIIFTIEPPPPHHHHWHQRHHCQELEDTTDCRSTRAVGLRVDLGVVAPSTYSTMTIDKGLCTLAIEYSVSRICSTIVAVTPGLQCGVLCKSQLLVRRASTCINYLSIFVQER